MRLKIIQVPMDEGLKQELDVWAEKAGRPRAELIRNACREYLQRRQEMELDRQYVEGYHRSPETQAEVQGLGLLAAQVWAEEFGEEDWSKWLARCSRRHALPVRRKR